MKYKPVVTGNQSNGSAGKARVETVHDKDYILLSLWTQDPLFSFSSKDSPGDGFKPLADAEKKDAEDLRNEHMSPTANAASIKNNVADKNIVYGCADDPYMPNLEEIQVWTFMDLPYEKRAIGTKWIYRNKKDERGIVVRNRARLVLHGYTQEERIDYDKVFALVARIKAIRLFLSYASIKNFVVYQMYVKSAFLYGKIEEEVYVCQSLGFEDPGFPDRVYKVEKALFGLHQAPRACQEKYVNEILKKFGFSTVKTISTPIDTSKPLMKDENAKDVDVHLYRSIIGSLMYLTSSKPDIMFVAYTYYYQLKVNPASHKVTTIVDVNAVEDVHNLVAFLSKPTKSKGFEQIIDFLNANPIKYALTIHAKVDGKKVIISEATIRRDLKFDDEGEVDCLSNKVIFEQLPLMGKSKNKDTQETQHSDPTDEVLNKDNVPAQSNDLPLSRVNTLESGEDRLKLQELMKLCTKLSKRVLNMETTKTTQAKKISSLKRRDKRFEKKKKSRTYRLQRLYKVGLSARVESSAEEQSLDEEDASKHGRNIADIDADDETTLVDETVEDQRRYNDQYMFDTWVLDDEEVVVEKTVAVKKPKIRGIVVKDHEEPSKSKTTTTPTLVADNMRPKAKSIVMKEPSEATTTILIPTHVKDKGKRKMVEPEMPLKKKAQISLDEELAFKLQAEQEEEERIARKKALEANIAKWDDVQAMMDADYELAARLQEEEQGELTIKEKSRLFVELMDKRKNHFAKLRAEEKRRKPPNKA
uniref:Retrovirus-related Pol polyprotein from transposon TNT 1-94 n=1 Tax=Tanacetum cinerariifolium TaxID=118510 RepID=A0A6L2L7P8_TANCI|nr:retrovirus-related Pol polyprotein from transposon TNT 1-94 [Tanacetum cinerariifolium]